MKTIVIMLSIILTVTIFGTYGYNITSSNNLIYAQNNFLNPYNEEAEAMGDILAMALLKDRAEGFEDGKGPHFEKAIQNQEEQIGFELSEDVQDTLLKGAQHHLTDLGLQ